MLDSRLPYVPHKHPRLSFADTRRAFAEGTATPRSFLEQCIETMEAREPTVRAFVSTNLPNARVAADASTERYRVGRPLSEVDGLPIAIKDVFESQDMPTQQNSPLYADWHTGRDAAHVYVLRRAGALIVGKTVTTEFAMSTPGPTRNPFDANRTPGGSSSGSCASVGASMVPVASGSQVRGSMMRPAGYCGNYALKPTYGAINTQGGHGLSAASQCVMGPIAATLQDCWETAFFMSSRAGGDPGYPGLYGEATLGSGKRLERVIRLDTLGWSEVEPEAKDTFERFVADLSKLGVKVLSRHDDPRIEALEAAMTRIPEFMLPLFAWENRWLGWIARDRGKHLISQKVLEMIEDGDKMTIEDYRRTLERRAHLGRLFAATGELAEACITLCGPGPAPVGMPVGSPNFADISSNLLAPALAMPLLEVGGMPLGVQLVGFPHQDYRLMLQARWLNEAYFQYIAPRSASMA